MYKIQNFYIKKLYHTQSTNIEALKLIKSKTKKNFIIVSLKQYQGKGANKSHWVSVKNNLHISILLCTTINICKIQQIQILVNIAIYYSIIKIIKNKNKKKYIKIKFFNDILIKNKKVAGIMIQYIQYLKKKYLIIGIGINTNKYPTKLKFYTTSFQKHNIKITHHKFLKILTKYFNTIYKTWNNNTLK